MPANETPDVDARLARMERLVTWLDEAIKIPGTEHRLGWDAILGLAPAVGDLTSAALSMYIVNEARALGVPKWLIGRMVWNVSLDALVGIIPILGDLFDVTFKANRRNMDLLRKHLGKDTIETTAVVQEDESSREG